MFLSPTTTTTNVQNTGNAPSSSIPSDTPSVPPSSNTAATPSSTPFGHPSESASPSSDNLDVTTPPSMVPSDIPSLAGSQSPTLEEMNVSCAKLVSVGFDTAGNGTLLNAGDYVGDGWFDRYDLNISAFATVGGFAPNNQARIFDRATHKGTLILEVPTGKQSSLIVCLLRFPCSHVL